MESAAVCVDPRGAACRDPPLLADRQPGTLGERDDERTPGQPRIINFGLRGDQDRTWIPDKVLRSVDGDEPRPGVPPVLDEPG